MAVLEPPLLFAYTVYVVRFSSWVGTPHNVPFSLPKFKPEGSDGLISQDVMEPAPVMFGASGKSGWAVLLVNVRFSGL